MAALTITDVSKVFGGIQVLHPLNLTVADGSFCCMLGSSGSGKSTLLRIVAGLEEPNTGTVQIGTRDVTRLAVEKRNIGFVFQNYALFPHLSVRSNVTFGLRAHGMSSKKANMQADEMLKLVGLGEFGGRSPAKLSGGQQQRVALARALVTSPDLLLLDEPLSALDRKIRGEMQRELKRIHKETGLTTVMVTHDQEEAMDLGDQVMMLDSGHVQQNGSPETLYRSPNNAFVAPFLGPESRGRGTIRVAGNRRIAEIGTLSFDVQGDALQDGESANVVVMAESVRVGPISSGESADGFRGTLTALDFFGPFARAEVSTGEIRIPSTMLSHNADRLRIGDEVHVSIATGGVHAFRDGAAPLAGVRVVTTTSI